MRTPMLPLVVLLTSLVACSDPAVNDSDLQAAVTAAIASSSDLPAGALQVQVMDGVVTISGSLDCESCGGSRNPGGNDTIQMSLGAVVRAVPGVQQVEFVFL